MGGTLSALFWCLCQKLSLSPLYFNKTLLHKSSEQSSLVSGPRLNYSPEAKNPRVFAWFSNKLSIPLGASVSEFSVLETTLWNCSPVVLGHGSSSASTLIFSKLSSLMVFRFLDCKHEKKCDANHPVSILDWLWIAQFSLVTNFEVCILVYIYILIMSLLIILNLTRLHLCILRFIFGLFSIYDIKIFSIAVI